jgi:hypothetical protein
MGRRIEQQENGLYAVWSTIVDDYIWIDCTKAEVINVLLENEIRRLREQWLSAVLSAPAANEKRIEELRAGPDALDC